jgi:hypothetical protein
MPESQYTEAPTFNSTGAILDTGHSLILSDPSGRQIYELRFLNGNAKSLEFIESLVGHRVDVVGVIDGKANAVPDKIDGVDVQVVIVADARPIPVSKASGTIAVKTRAKQLRPLTSI